MSLFLLSGDIEIRSDPAGADPNLEFKQATASNTEIPTPVTVGHYARHYAPPYDFATENAAIYCRIDHRPGEDDFRYWFYGEITEQSLVGGSMTKVIHRGKGDAHYVAMMGDNTSGFGYESAMFGGWQNPPTDTIPKQENGYIATFQGAGGFQESIKNQANSIGFQTLVHDDGVDPTDPDAWTTAYGLFYANNALNNAFVTRRSEYAPSGYSHYKLMDHDLRPLWQVMDDGAGMLLGSEATALAQNQPSPSQTLRGYYWTGAAEQANQTQITHATAGAGGGVLQISVGNPGAEVLALQVRENGRLNINNSNPPASAADTGVAGDVTWDSGYLYVCTATDTWKRAALTTWA